MSFSCSGVILGAEAGSRSLRASFSLTEKPQKTQKTKPKKGKPLEIPVPKRGEIDALLKKSARTPDK